MAESRVEEFLEKLNAALATGYGEGVASVTLSPDDVGEGKQAFELTFNLEASAGLAMSLDEINDPEADLMEGALSVATYFSSTLAETLGPLVMGMVQASPESFLPSEEKLEQLFADVEESEDVDTEEVPEEAG